MYNFLSKRFEVERANSLHQILFHFKRTRYLLVFLSLSQSVSVSSSQSFLWSLSSYRKAILRSSLKRLVR